jgi:hypothetical protein
LKQHAGLLLWLPCNTGLLDITSRSRVKPSLQYRYSVYTFVNNVLLSYIPLLHRMTIQQQGQSAPGHGVLLYIMLTLIMHATITSVQLSLVAILNSVSAAVQKR